MSVPAALIGSVWKYLLKNPELVLKAGLAAGQQGAKFATDFKAGKAKPDAVPTDVTAAFFEQRRDELVAQLEETVKLLKKHNQLEREWRSSGG